MAEEIFCDDITTGASNDLERATKIARQMVTQYGMSTELGTQIFGQPNHEVFLGRDYGNTQDYSEETARRIDDEVARIMKEAHDTAYKILDERKDQMHLMAQVLMERETVDGDECQALLNNEWDKWLEYEKTGATEAAATTIASPEAATGVEADATIASPEATTGALPVIEVPVETSAALTESSSVETAEAPTDNAPAEIAENPTEKIQPIEDPDTHTAPDTNDAPEGDE